MKAAIWLNLSSAVLTACVLGSSPCHAQSIRYDELSNIPLIEGYLSKEDNVALKDELLFQRAVQSYLWAQPALNIYAMKEGSEKTFGKGYNVLPVWKERLNANTQVTTPNGRDLCNGIHRPQAGRADGAGGAARVTGHP